MKAPFAADKQWIELLSNYLASSAIKATSSGHSVSAVPGTPSKNTTLEKRVKTVRIPLEERNLGFLKYDLVETSQVSEISYNADFLRLQDNTQD